MVQKFTSQESSFGPNKSQILNLIGEQSQFPLAVLLQNIEKEASSEQNAHAACTLQISRTHYVDRLKRSTSAEEAPQTSPSNINPC